MGIAGHVGNVELTKWIGSVRVSASTYNTALAFPAPMADPPATSATTGIGLVATQGRSHMQVTFAGTDAANETFGYQVIGLLPVKGVAGEGWIPVRLATGVVTLGAKQTGTAGAFVESATAYLADTITETTSSRFADVYSPADDTVAVLSIDVSEFQFVYVQVSRNGQTAATMDVITNLCDAAVL